MPKGEGRGVVEQSGVIPYRVRPDGLLQVLLVTSTEGYWIVPKGGIGAGLTPEESGRKEAWEEAGVLGFEVGPEVGHYDYDKFGRTHRVRLFAMRVNRVMSVWDEMERRQREWVSVDEAIRRVPFMQLRDVFERFEQIMHVRVAV